MDNMPIIETPKLWITSIARPYGTQNGTVRLYVMPHEVDYQVTEEDILQAIEIGRTMADMEKHWDGGMENWYDSPKDVLFTDPIKEGYSYLQIEFSLNLRSKVTVVPVYPAINTKASS